MNNISSFNYYHIHRLGKYDEYWEVDKEFLYGDSLMELNKDNPRYNAEIEFEKIRLSYYPKLPSRYRSLFVCKENDIDLWIKKLNLGKREFKIFKIKVFGYIFWANVNYFDEFCSNLDSKLIHNYWNGLDSEYLRTEGLFIGNVKVIEEFKIEDFSSERTERINILSKTERPNFDTLINFDEYT